MIIRMERMNRFRSILLVAALFSLIAAFSCNSSDTKTSGKKTATGDNFNPFFPLKEGNKWVYINEAPRTETELFTLEAKDLKKVDGGMQMKVSSFPYLTKDNVNKTIKVTTSGEIEIENYMGSSGMFVPSADNFKAGYKWSFGIFTGYINGDTSLVKTEDGNFDRCYYVMMTDGFTFSYEMWYKKDVGIVKWGANRTNPPQLTATYYVLKEHILN